MALGYCIDCKKLVTIEPREPRGEGTKSRNWYPVSHAKQEHDRCGGGFVDGECTRCGANYSAVAPSGAITLKPVCPGVKKPI